MNSYKVMFANNEVINCQPSDRRLDHDSEYYYEYMGQIMYAMVIANGEEAAKKAAKNLITATASNKLILPPFATAA